MVGFDINLSVVIVTREVVSKISSLLFENVLICAKCIIIRNCFKNTKYEHLDLNSSYGIHLKILSKQQKQNVTERNKALTNYVFFDVLFLSRF